MDLQLEDITDAPAETIVARKAPTATVRWKNSVYICVPADEGECGWRKHFDHSTRTVVGFLISLAAIDRERENFCWPGWSAITRNATKLLERPLGRSQVFAIVALLVQHGVIVRAKRFRRGAMRAGYIVREHSEWTNYYSTLGCCGLRSHASDLEAWEQRAITRRCKRREDEVTP